MHPDERPSPPRILVIDDEDSLRSVLCRTLVIEGFRVHAASNGNEGLKLMGSETFDLVITDLLMPETDGIETVIAIRASNPRMKIITISGGMPGAGLDFLEVSRMLGASATIKKPFDIDSLLECIRSVLGEG